MGDCFDQRGLVILERRIAGLAWATQKVQGLRFHIVSKLYAVALVAGGLRSFNG